MKKRIVKDSDYYGTPDRLFNPLTEYWNFDLDAAASDHNHKCERYLSEKDDALSIDWHGDSVFCNPPYSKAAGPIDVWLAHAHQQCVEYGNCGKVVMLLQGDTSTLWYAKSLYQAHELCFLKGRVTFIGAKGPAKFGTLLVIYRREQNLEGKANITLWDWKREPFIDRGL